jgi:TetR/AcrR family transcriptional regulator, transcriptional repressor for nem operon
MSAAKQDDRDSRRRLLDAARDLIWRASYAGVSVDDLCKAAEVNKGTFYHFFKSKAELATASFEDFWENIKRPLYDRLFSPQVPALTRLEQFVQMTVEAQTAMHKECGQVLGCPYTAVGSEIATQDESLRKLAHEMFGRSVRYLESAIRDAQRDGTVGAGDPTLLANDLHSFLTGVLLKAKVANSLTPLAGLTGRAMRLLGVRTSTAKS